MNNVTDVMHTWAVTSMKVCCLAEYSFVALYPDFRDTL
jgi:hypothetical protein